MRKIKYPLIVSDFDGTLINADGTICEENKRAVAAYLAAGGKFAISTGRLPAGIVSRARELGLQGMVCCCQGAIILDIESEQVILGGTLSNESTVAACKSMEELDLHIHAYGLWEYYSNMDDEPLKIYEKLTKTQATLVTDRKLSEYIEEARFCAYKLLAMVEPKHCAKVMERLAKTPIEGCEITKSAEFLVEIVNTRYSKGTAVTFLADYYGVPLEKVIAVGDQQNDLPMIEKAGLGIAVANADEGLKSAATVVSERTNEEGAIAEIIENYAFYEEE